ncbi:hypothetical protein [Streptomyces sp. NPDC002044]|uniref:hypothetical protein n=1 Tax=Streptomyces sp. NPDC002044 TaxID=3154662 RepID=UPI00331BC016
MPGQTPNCSRWEAGLIGRRGEEEREIEEGRFGRVFGGRKWRGEKKGEGSRWGKVRYRGVLDERGEVGEKTGGKVRRRWRESDWGEGGGRK